MRVLIVAAGTHGDTRPVIALGRRLKGAGYQVAICAAAKDRSAISDYGLRYHDCGVDYMETINDAISKGSGQVALLRRWVAFLRNDVSQRFQRLQEIISASDRADLIIGAGMEFAAPTMAEFFKIPYVHMLHIPPALRNSSVPPLFCPAFGLPRLANRLLWWVNDCGYNFLLRKVVNANRQKLGLPKVVSIYDHVTRKTLIAADELLAKVPGDAKSSYVQSRYWHLREEAELDPGLQSFIESGPPPVYVGFGSMSKVSEGMAGKHLQAAFRKTSRRIILSKGWGNFSDFEGNDNVRVIGHVPHLSLFPKMAAVVHHGGAGTTHSAALSGVPQVIVPHAFDQFFWAHRVRRLKLGPKAPSVTSMTARKLVQAIDEAVDNPAYASNARRLSTQLLQADVRDDVTRVMAMMA